MQIKYTPDVDILMVWLSEDPVDHAEEADGVITHFTTDGRPVLLEIQGARDFLLGCLTSIVKGEEVKVL
jgi:uncharacterized protein YuzE